MTLSNTMNANNTRSTASIPFRLTVMPRLPRLTRLLLLAALLPVLAGCELTDSNEAPGQTDLIVANGGNFSDQNGFLSVIDMEAGTVSHGDDLGGFVQGIRQNDDKLYTLINTFGEGRVDIHSVTEAGLVRTGQWAPLTAPRDIAFTDGSAWVTNFVWGAPGHIVRVDLATGALSAPIEVGEAPEGVVHMNGFIYVANNGSLGAGSTLSRIAVAQPGAAASLTVPCDGPRDLAAVGTSRLVVVCTGKTVYNDDFSQILEQTDGRVVFLSVGSGGAVSVLSTLALEAQAGNANGSRAIHMSDATGELFVSLSDGSIQVVDVASRQARDRIVPQDDGSVSGLAGVAYQATRDVLYVGRLARSGAGPFPDYTASGEVHEIGRDGSIRARWTVGPAPSALLLR